MAHGAMSFRAKYISLLQVNDRPIDVAGLLLKSYLSKFPKLRAAVSRRYGFFHISNAIYIYIYIFFLCVCVLGLWGRGTKRRSFILVGD